MTRLNLSDNSIGGHDDEPGVHALADMLKNNIGVDQAKGLVTILKEHPTLKSLCGNRGDETKLDMSGKEIGAEGAIMLAPEIIDNGALTMVNTTGNKIVFNDELFASYVHKWAANPQLTVLCKEGNKWGEEEPSFYSKVFDEDMLSLQNFKALNFKGFGLGGAVASNNSNAPNSLNSPTQRLYSMGCNQRHDCASQPQSSYSGAQQVPRSRTPA
jgi:hypothetical protein